MPPPPDPQSADGQFQRHSGELLRLLTRQAKCAELAADLRPEPAVLRAIEAHLPVRLSHLPGVILVASIKEQKPL